MENFYSLQKCGMAGLVLCRRKWFRLTALLQLPMLRFEFSYFHILDKENSRYQVWSTNFNLILWFCRFWDAARLRWTRPWPRISRPLNTHLRCSSNSKLLFRLHFIIFLGEITSDLLLVVVLRIFPLNFLLKCWETVNLCLFFHWNKAIFPELWRIFFGT